MSKKTKSSRQAGIILIILGLLCISIALSLIAIDSHAKLQNSIRAALSPEGQSSSQQQGTFGFEVTPTPTPGPSWTPAPKTTKTTTSKTDITPGPLKRGGALPPDAPYYCIDDEDPDGCDDQTAFHVPKGSGGTAGTCGTIIEEGHNLVKSLPQFLKGLRDSLNPAVKNTCHDTGTYSSGYISTFFVIDAYNLAGFHELSKTNPSHIRGDNLLNWWKSPTAQAAGYRFIPYTPTLLQDHANGQINLTGCVMFLNLSSGVHVGLMNALELVDTHGNGVISMLQSGVSYFIDRFEVVGWDIKNTPLHQTRLSSVAGFGCR